MNTRDIWQVSNVLDEDGELELEFEYQCINLNKEEAKELILHLIKVFELETEINSTLKVR